MKKLIVALVTIITGLYLALVGFSCKKDPNVITVNEVTHSTFYAPLYIAINKGYFTDENLKIDLVNGGGADKSMTAILTNAAQIGLMGPEAAVYVAAQDGQNAPKIFGQLTKRDGSFLVGRNQIENFKWTDLIGKEIVAGRRGGMPAMTLEYALNLHGIYDGVNVTLNYDIPFNNMAPAFEAGTGDFVTLFEPLASEFQAAGHGYILDSVGLKAGEVPFTAFMATETYLKNNPQIIKSFLRAIHKGYKFLTTAPIDDVITALEPSFVGTSRESLRYTIESYRDIDAWVSTPVMSESAYNRLITIMTNAGELTTTVPFSKIVDNSFAQEVILESI